MGRIINEKSKVLATTTLAGALLFTGVGATHNAHAADVVNDYNVEDYATKVLGEHYTEAGKVVAQANREEQDYYKVLFAGEQDNGPGEAKVYRDGRVVAVTPNDPTNWKVLLKVIQVILHKILTQQITILKQQQIMKQQTTKLQITTLLLQLIIQLLLQLLLQLITIHNQLNQMKLNQQLKHCQKQAANLTLA